MTGRVTIDADLNFVQGLIHHGGADLKKCYQCSTCTVACPLTPDEAPFPRKEMLWAQWGMKDKLVRDMDLWLCHNCNDCTDLCPRGAKPGEVMSALRNQTIEHFSYPASISRAARTLNGNVILFLIPMFLIALVNAYKAMSSFIKGLKEQYPPQEDGESFLMAIKGTIKDVLSHVEFKKCSTNKRRSISHKLMMYGFIGLFITTNSVFVLHWLHEFGFDVQTTPLPFFHPVKILGNVSSIAAFAGIYLIIRDRLKNSDETFLTLFDWMFIGNMFLTVVTGILCQVFRVGDHAYLSFITYYIHLVQVFYLLAYASQTKFGHIFYRPAAMIYSRYSGRNKDIFRNL